MIPAAYFAIVPAGGGVAKGSSDTLDGATTLLANSGWHMVDFGLESVAGLLDSDGMESASTLQ